MIVRSFYNKRVRRYAHLVVCAESDVAAVIDPITDDLPDYLRAAETSGARLEIALQTAARPVDPNALRALDERLRIASKAPARHPRQPAATQVVGVGDAFEIGRLVVDVVPNTPPAGPDVAYRIGDTLFTGWTLVRGGLGHEDGPADPEELVARARADLHALLAARKLTGKEADLADGYLGLLDRLGRAPSARELAAAREGLDRGAVHVLIHGIRRKQVALGQVPILLHGQMQKWLKGLQGEPAFTAHERIFLDTYLRFVDEHRRVPTGPEMLAGLPEGTPIQWVRKRVHTIRRKQAAFGRAPLQMGREPRRSR